MNASSSVWQQPEFRSYLGTTAFTGIAFAMQQLLLSWLLIGVLELPATQVGMIQALTGIPGIFFMLFGGARADKVDPRSLLIQVYFVAPLLPLFLIGVLYFSQLSILSVLVWGLGMSVVVFYSSPAQQAILNRVVGNHVQKAVTATTAIGFLLQMIGLGMAGTMDRFGLIPILLIQSICLVLGFLAVRRLTPHQPQEDLNPLSPVDSIIAGLKAVYANRVIFQVLSINFVSSIFNAGAFMTVFPFIVKRIYDGDALLLSLMMIVFYAGAVSSNYLMFRFMPLIRPGRLFLLVQLSRMLILGVLWIRPEFWLALLATIAWGLNMGITTTLARTIVQESAAAEFRARILSVYSLGLLGSAPMGALLLGWIIERFGTLNALVPALVISIVLFIYGVLFTDVYKYQSPKHLQ